MMRGDDSVSNGQAEARPLTALLGGEKRVEELVNLIWGHTASRVRNQDFDGIVGRAVAGGNGNGASLLHGLNGIYEDVHEHLLKLGFVSHDGRKLRVVVGGHGDVQELRLFCNERQRVLEDLVEVGKFGVDLGMPGELQQALDDITAALALPDDLLEVFAVGIILLEFLEGEPGQRHDGAQGIVDLMGNARRQDA